MPTEYVVDSKGEQTLVLTSVDLELLKDRTINTKIGRYKNKNISAR